VFEAAHSGLSGRATVPPIFVFANSGVWRDVVFLGLAVPGTVDLRSSEDLVAIWKIAGGKRFQNYRARFTVIEVPCVTRAWVQDIISGTPHTPNAPAAWQSWVQTGRPKPLLARRSLAHRTKQEQLPPDPAGRAVIETIYQFFSTRPHDFEACAASLTRLLLPDVASLDLTRPTKDGGRDAVGQLRIGRGPTSIVVDFALEAKCYSLANGVGVREMSRLISRLRHRQFGVLVTTSYVDLQTYQEIKEDGHPIVIISAADICGLLKDNGMDNPPAVKLWLEREFPERPRATS
jgi:AspBHI-like restriction endonuclease/restriction endonuclease